MVTDGIVGYRVIFYDACALVFDAYTIDVTVNGIIYDTGVSC